MNWPHDRPGRRGGWLAMLLVGPGLLALSGCGESSVNGGEGQKQDPVPVVPARVQKQTLERTVRSIGTLQSPQQVELRPQVSGVLREIRFEDGQRIEAGRVLFRLDQRKLNAQRQSHQADLAASRARLADDRRVLKNIRRLRQRQAATEDELLQARTDVATAEADVRRMKAQIALIREQIKDARLKAPFSGVITASSADVGDYVQMGEKLATVYQVSPIEVRFTVPGRYMSRIQPGQPVRVKVEAYPGRVFTGRLTYVSPSVDEQTRDIRVRGLLENDQKRLKPGTFATVHLVIEELKNRPVIPEGALVATRSGYMVFVVGEDGLAHERAVKIGLRQTGRVEITQGLKAGERVINTGHLRLSEGTPVNPRPSEPESSSAASE